MLVPDSRNRGRLRALGREDRSFFGGKRPNGDRPLHIVERGAPLAPGSLNTDTFARRRRQSCGRFSFIGGVAVSLFTMGVRTSGRLARVAMVIAMVTLFAAASAQAQAPAPDDPNPGAITFTG